MNAGGKLLLIAAVLVAAVGTWYKVNYPSYSWRQKMTVTVATPRGEVSGSSVVAVEWHKNFFSGGWGGALFHQSIKGEATVVDLGDGQLLFALLSHPGAYEYSGLVALNLFKSAADPIWSPEAFAKVQAAKGRGPQPLPSRLYPMFVRFRDINDPKTVERVDPSNLAVSFGPSVRLARVTVEIADDSVTTGIEKKLTWLVVGYPEMRLVPASGGPVGDVPSSHLLTHSSFKRF